MKLKDIVIRALHILILVAFACVSTAASVGLLVGILTLNVLLTFGMAALLFVCICLFVWMADRNIIDEWL